MMFLRGRSCFSCTNLRQRCLVNVAGEFDQSVLETEARSAEKGPVAPAGELDAFEHAGEALEGTAGGGPKSIERFYKFSPVPAVVRDGVGIHSDSEFSNLVYERRVARNLWWHGGKEIQD